MNREEIEEMLKNFGLSEYEAKAYYALLLLGHSKASEICKLARIPQSKIYEVLDRLAEKNLVEVYEVRPKEFKPISPQVVLRNFLEAQERKIKEMKEKIEELVTSLNSRGTKVFEGIWASRERGWKVFMNKATEMFEHAENYVFVMSKYFSWSSRLAKAVKACIKRGVEIKTIASKGIDETNYYRAKWYHDNGVKIRVLRSGKYPSLIDVDGKEVLLRLDKNSSRRNPVFTSIWSKDEGFTRIIDTFVKHIWRNSRPVDFEKLKKLVEKA